MFYFTFKFWKGYAKFKMLIHLAQKEKNRSWPADEWRWNFSSKLKDGSDIHRFPAVHVI